MPSIHTDPAHRTLTAALAGNLIDDEEVGDALTVEQAWEKAAELAVVVRRLGWTPPANS